MLAGLEWAASTAAALTPLIPIIGAFTIPLTYIAVGRRWLVYAIALGIELLALSTSLLVALHVFSTNTVLYYAFAGFPAPLGIVYQVDKVGALLGALVATVFVIVTVAQPGLCGGLRSAEWYYPLYLALEAGLLGLVYTGDVFNVFVMLEVASVATYALVAFRREVGYPLDAAVKYAAFGTVASSLYFLAAVMAYRGFGSLSMALIAGRIRGAPEAAPLAMTVFGLALWAFMIESALVPHHFWLPPAYSAAPAAVSATLSATAEGVAVYLVMRFMYTVVGPAATQPFLPLFMILGAAAVVLGALSMAFQGELMSMVAYSTVMDMGYVYMALALGPGSIEIPLFGTLHPADIALYYIVSHAVVEPLMFLSAGVVRNVFGSTRFDDIKGCLRCYPSVAVGLAIGGFSVAGVPPTNLFFAKLALLMALLISGNYWAAFIVVLGSALSLVAVFRMLYATYFEIYETVPEPGIRVSSTVKAVLALLIAAVFVMGILFAPLIHGAIHPATLDLVNVGRYIEAATRYLTLVGGFR